MRLRPGKVSPTGTLPHVMDNVESDKKSDNESYPDGKLPWKRRRCRCRHRHWHPHLSFWHYYLHRKTWFGLFFLVCLGALSYIFCASGGNGRGRLSLPRRLHPDTPNLSPPITNDKSFGFTGDEGHAYRIGDVFVLWYLMEYHITFDYLLAFYEHYFPGSLAHEYLLETQAVPEKQDGQNKDIDPAFRNITALLTVMDRRTASDHSDHRVAQPNELIVHLRLGDILTRSNYIDLNKTMQELWEADTGFVNFDGRVKNNYNFAEYRQLVQRLPADKAFNTCVMVGASNFLTDSKEDHRNQEYKELVANFFQDTLHCQIEYYTNDNRDETLLFLASAHYLIAGMGGFSQIAAGCVRARRGKTHAIYDKFNGRVAGSNDQRLDPDERRTYAEEYIDWSLVTYVPPLQYRVDSDSEEGR